MKGKIYSAKEINTTAANEEEQWLKIDKGLFVVVAPEPTNSKRVVGKVIIKIRNLLNIVLVLFISNSKNLILSCTKANGRNVELGQKKINAIQIYLLFN